MGLQKQAKLLKHRYYIIVREEAIFGSVYNSVGLVRNVRYKLLFYIYFSRLFQFSDN